MTEQRSLLGYVDIVTPVVTGWAGFAPGSTTPAEGALGISLMLGMDRIGTVARAIPRPDVDAFLGYEGVPKGFVVPAAAISAFSAMTGLPAPTLLVESDDTPSLVIPFDPERVSPLAMLHATKNWSLRDAWFASRQHLAMRFENRGDAGFCYASGFQRQLGADGVLTRLPASGRLSGAVSVVTLELHNPFLPVLLVLTDSDGAIVATDWIPFPSLARNGLHAPEVDALAAGAERNETLMRVSLDLADAFVARRTASIVDRMRCDTILFDASGCTGTEAMFDTDLTDMITRLLGLTISVQTSDANTAMAELLTAQISTPDFPADDAATTLFLPGDAVPTLSVLLNDALFDPESGRPMATHIRLPDPLAPHVWLVTPPGHPAPTTMPVLRPPATVQGAVSISGPLAIRIGKIPTRMAGSAIFPRATDAPETPHPRKPLSVIVAAAEGDVPPLTLLQSIAQQAGFDDGELLYALRADQSRDQVDPILQALFPERYQIVEHGIRDARLREFRHVAGFAIHPTLMLLDPATILHDRRTFARLAVMLDEPQVGTASAMLINSEQPAGNFLCAGYFLQGVDFRNLPSLMFDMPDTRRILDPEYDVPAAPLSALAVRKDVLAALPGPNPGSVIAMMDEIRLGLDILRNGLRNVVTTDFSVATTRNDLRPTGLSVSFPLVVGGGLLEQIVGHATGLQRL